MQNHDQKNETDVMIIRQREICWNEIKDKKKCQKMYEETFTQKIELKVLLS